MRNLAMILTLLIPTQLWADDFDYYVFRSVGPPVFVTLKAMQNNRDSVTSSKTTNGYCTGFGRSIIRVDPLTVIHPNVPHHAR